VEKLKILRLRGRVVVTPQADLPDKFELFSSSNKNSPRRIIRSKMGFPPAADSLGGFCPAAGVGRKMRGKGAWP
jgi:hypothetical protein